MPNRMLRDYTDSERVNVISWRSEVLFVRLMMKADDYGSFHANPKLVKSFCFPLKADSIRDADISLQIAECEKAGLIVVYTSGQKEYLRIVDFGQRLRNKRTKFPDPPPEALKRLQQLAATRRNSPPEDEVEEEVENEEEVECRSSPSAAKNKKGNPEERESQSAFAPGAPAAGEYGDIEPGEMHLHSEINTCYEMYFNRTYFSQSRELLMVKHGIDEAILADWGTAFNAYLITTGKLKKTLKDYAEHFANWLPKQNLNLNPKEFMKNGNGNSNTGKKSSAGGVDMQSALSKLDQFSEKRK